MLTNLEESTAEQYSCPCLDIDELSIDALVAYAHVIGAVHEPEPGLRCIVAKFPGRPPELFTEDAFRRSALALSRKETP